MNIITQRNIYDIGAPVCREGCPNKMTPTYQISSLNQERTELIHEYTTMRLVHQSKNGEIKNSLPLGPIHKELELASLPLQGSGSSNILLSKVSFDCLITDSAGVKRRDYLCFDLKILGANSTKKPVFSYEWIEKAYGDKEKLYAKIKKFYDAGRKVAVHKHGTEPDYTGKKPSHDQFIRHTEQLLVAYLALPDTAKMLANQLRTAIRGKYPEAAEVKVYNMGLHMHSTKTCCAPCEYTLLGLMNKKKHSFLSNFSRATSIPNEMLKMTLPNKSDFRLLVTVGASQSDNTHQKQPTYKELILDEKTPTPFFDISVKSAEASKHIFTSMLDCEHDEQSLHPSNLDNYTVGISGSEKTTTTKNRITYKAANTLKKVTELKSAEIDHFSIRSLLHEEDETDRVLEKYLSKLRL